MSRFTITITIMKIIINNKTWSFCSNDNFQRNRIFIIILHDEKGDQRSFAEQDMIYMKIIAVDMY